MKSIIKFLAVAFTAVLLFTSCEFDDNGPMPDPIESTVAYVIPDASSVLIIDKNSPASFNYTGQIDIMFDSKVDKATLVVAMLDISKGDADYDVTTEHQYVLEDDIISFPHDFSIDIDELIAAIPGISSIDDIEIGDMFKFFVNTTSGGKEFPAFIDVDGQVIKTASSSLVAILKNLEGVGNFDANASVPCPIDFNGIDGTYEYYEDGAYAYDVTIIKNPDPSEPYGIIIPDIWWGAGSGSELKVSISMSDLSVYGDNQTILLGDFYGYGNMQMINIGSGSWNTCTNTIQFVGTPYLEAGASWGVSPIFKYVKK